MIWTDYSSAADQRQRPSTFRIGFASRRRSLASELVRASAARWAGVGLHEGTLTRPVTESLAAEVLTRPAPTGRRHLVNQVIM